MDVGRAKQRLADVRERRQQLSAQLEEARRHLRETEDTYREQLAASVLDGVALPKGAGEALHRGRADVEKLDAALTKLQTLELEAERAVIEAERAEAQAVLDKLDADIARLYADAARSLGAVWQSLSGWASNGRLAEHQRVGKRFGLRLKHQGALERLKWLARESHGVLKQLEAGDTELYAKTGAPSARARESFLMGLKDVLL